MITQPYTGNRDDRPLWITGVPRPDSRRSLRQAGYPQLLHHARGHDRSCPVAGSIASPRNTTWRTDRRSFSGETTQAEAIPPRRLREIVIDAIEARLERGVYDAVLEREVEIRERLARRLEALR